MAKAKQFEKIGSLLVLLGSIVSLIIGILMLIPGWGWLSWGLGSLFYPFTVIFAIVLIILSLITLATSGVIKFPWKLEKNWLMLLILGILQLVFGGSIGAVLVIIGAILMLF
jgi:hypothetical protein